MSGIDVEVYTNERPIRWCAYRGADPTLLASGTARTRIGVEFAIWRARRRLSAGVGFPPNPEGTQR